MKEKILDNKQNILFLIVVILVLWNIFNTNGIKTDVKSYKTDIKNIQVDVDSVKLINKEMNEKVLVINGSINTITEDIFEIDNNIDKVKDKTNEKIISIGFIGNVELERLFANRYPD